MDSTASSPVVLVTGASSGLGRATATLLASQGYRVFGTSRTPSRAPEAPFTLLPLDVRDDASVEACVAEVLRAAGRIDVLISNAGCAFVGAVEETSIAEAQAQMETNCFGALRVMRAVLPAMRVRQRGRIVAISSLAGLLPPPFLGAYAASKHALEALSESLAYEVRPHGVHVSLVELDGMRTGIPFARPSRREPSYAEPSARMLARLERITGDAGGDPAELAGCVLDVLANPAPALRYVLGKEATLAVAARRQLSEADYIRTMVGRLGLWDAPTGAGTRREGA
ncbi:SDR family NAD(P)-dependent oxidoreductase [Corallococcus silvisoli]|uniref:SDR family NAD(P)-dependent oxidoreductase n=1 Tax=Corallococcus silvisoli TaxID=2697031 RepID=UPI0013783302|nr:SDR family NAD(P)-dependent oxidoreductase [Corallococcus silvisoli]NBD08400.1 SDR family NAD(P)-dependent oxidoreductase [Corallococcus silvisoli]